MTLLLSWIIKKETLTHGQTHLRNGLELIMVLFQLYIHKCYDLVGSV